MTGRNIQRYGLCGGYGEMNGRQGGQQDALLAVQLGIWPSRHRTNIVYAMRVGIEV